MDTPKPPAPNRHAAAGNAAPRDAKRVAVLGSTGSVGRNTLKVIAASRGRLSAVVLSGHTSLDRLVQQAGEVRPAVVVATDEEAAVQRGFEDLPAGVRVEVGQAALEAAVASDSVDVVVAAIVGSAGLRSTWAALAAGKTVALANKETLVVAGPLVGPLVKQTGAKLLPVDSEHSAIFQALQSGGPEEVGRLVLTASGGPFRTWPADDLKQATVHDALSHPTWDMGPKITVDSATMMNKALEIIEARWLFDVPADQIEVVLHPQSIVHSMVEFVDGSVVAQLSPPDMKLPIQYALDYPNRWVGVSERFDWSRGMQLEFLPPDPDRFPAIGLGFECARAGGSSGAVLNAANEAAVAAFLDGDLHFTEIVPACRSVLESHHFDAQPTLEGLMKLDRWARKEIGSWVCA
ncbi:MAG: 1-deoxy-D-xylulose-5-phosphate reductoisomerase [Planctomycetota bacterium]